MTKKVMFLACGSFSPPTPMHLRMFEIARDHFRDRHKYEVIGGIVSPVHDAYNKSGLVAAKHRCAMLKKSLRTSNWIRLSDWECNEQTEWTRTKISLQYHQNYMNSILNDMDTIENDNLPEWIPSNIKDYEGENVHVKLLCGADLLESFAVPGLWLEEDVEAILGDHGIIVISRSGTNPEKNIFESDLLNKYRNNITVITNWVPNEVSSTMARRHLNRGLSVKYMLDDYVVDYIKMNRLYGTGDTTNYVLIRNRNDGNRTKSISPGYINDNCIRNVNLKIVNSEHMDETDHSLTKSIIKEDARKNGQPKILRRETAKRNLINGRPGQAVQIHTDVNGTGTIEQDDEVGECKTSTKTLSADHKALDKKFEYLSDNQLDKLTNGMKNKIELIKKCDLDRQTLETLSAECLPTTSKRSQNDLIQFVFTSHGIRVISDKEYVV